MTVPVRCKVVNQAPIDTPINPPINTPIDTEEGAAG